MGDETPRLVVVCSDLHCGSSVGLMPPVVNLIEAGEKTHNAIQGYIWDCWRHFWTEIIPTIANGDPFILVLNGDLVEGVHHRTVELVSPDTTDHVRIAIECLREPVAMAAKTYIVRGTESHVRNMEDGIGRALGTERNPQNKNHFWDHLRLCVNDTIIAFAHHIPATSRNSLKGSQLSIQSIEEIVEYSLADEKRASAFFRAHRHVYGHYDEGRFSMTVTPSWQHATRHVRKIIPSALSQFGGAWADFRNKEPGEMPLVDKKLYPALAAKEVVV